MDHMESVVPRYVGERTPSRVHHLPYDVYPLEVLGPCDGAAFRRRHPDKMTLCVNQRGILASFTVT